MSRFEFHLQPDEQEQNDKKLWYNSKLKAACKQRHHTFSARDPKSLAAGDYHLIAVDKVTKVEKVLMVIERKTCSDLHRSFCHPAENYFYKLQRIDVQMRKLHSVGHHVVKVLLLEGDENACRWFPLDEPEEPKIKAIKTFRKRFQADGYYPGMTFVQTLDLEHTIDFLCDQLDAIKRHFDNSQQVPAIFQRAPSPELLKSNVDTAMSLNRDINQIFARYIKLVQQRGTGCKKAMDKIEKEYPGADFICPFHRYYGEYVKKDELGPLKCPDVDSPEHIPSFYPQGFVSPFQARAPPVARAPRQLRRIIKPVRQGPYQRRQNLRQVKPPPAKRSRRTGARGISQQPIDHTLCTGARGTSQQPIDLTLCTGAPGSSQEPIDLTHL